MSADEFLLWAMQQPEGCRYELVGGEVAAMAPERSSHALAKFRIARRLADAIEAACVPCTVYPDGMAVEIDAATIYEPDAMVRCGIPLPPDTLKVIDPVIVVEVRSPSTGNRDTGVKLADYFRLPSVRHYLIAIIESQTIIHHARDEVGQIATRIVRDGTLRLDPPGIVVDGLFEAAVSGP